MYNMSSMFSMGNVQGVKVATGTNYLKAGIHEVTFKGINLTEKGMELTFENDNGTHRELIFEPRSDQRTESQFGPNPSEAEQFMCKVKQIISALDPELADNIEKDGTKFTAPSFSAFVKLVKKYLDHKVGEKTFIKLIPTSGNFVGFPGFPAKLNKDGILYMSTKFIGEDLVLTPAEMTRIENAAKATPTPMKTDSDLDELKAEFEASPDEDDDLPF